MSKYQSRNKYKSRYGGVDPPEVAIENLHDYDLRESNEPNIDSIPPVLSSTGISTGVSTESNPKLSSENYLSENVIYADQPNVDEPPSFTPGSRLAEKSPLIETNAQSGTYTQTDNNNDKILYGSPSRWSSSNANANQRSSMVNASTDTSNDRQNSDQLNFELRRQNRKINELTDMLKDNLTTRYIDYTMPKYIYDSNRYKNELNRYNRYLSDFEYRQLISKVLSNIPRYFIGDNRERYKKVVDEVLRKGYLMGDSISDLETKAMAILEFMQTDYSTSNEDIIKHFLRPIKISTRKRSAAKKRSAKKRSTKKRSAAKKRSTKKRSTTKKRSAAKKRSTKKRSAAKKRA